MAVEHFFTLMMENRSFDHLLGFCNNPAIDGTSTTARVLVDSGTTTAAISDDAVDRMNDIDHEYPAVRRQLHAPADSDDSPVTMQGFYLANGAEALRCFPATAPETGVLRLLAGEYCLLQRWFSSMPGPTWPNRFFVHAATSGGLDNSPGSLTSLEAVALHDLGFDFQHGTIYDWLDKAGIGWRIYHDDLLPQALAIKGMGERFVDPDDDHFRWLKKLPDDLASGDMPPYVFIEPAYDAVNGFDNGNSQHASGTVSAGDALINWVYQQIRTAPLWPRSALLILYDEHGGFFDHVPPPVCAAPGDDDRNHSRAAAPQQCTFTRLGVRVPAVLVSPLVEQGTIVAAGADGAEYDHSSVIRTLVDLFPPLATALRTAGKTSLTERDRTAASLAPLFTLATARDDDQPLLAMLKERPAAIAAAERMTDRVPGTGDTGPASGFLNGFTHLAATVELARQKASAAQALPIAEPSALASAGGAQALIRQLAARHPKLDGKS